MDLALFGGEPVRREPFCPWPAYGPEEETALLQACGKSRSRSLVPFVTLTIETGARYGTIRTLQWGCVDFESRCLKWGRIKRLPERDASFP